MDQILGTLSSSLQLALEVDIWGWTKTVLFYAMLAICAAQTFYPILMIIAMFIRQLGFLAQWFHEVDEKSEQHGGEIIGSVLKAHGVDHIFTLGERTQSTILKGSEKSGIKVIQTKHEVTAIAAADANSRITGLPGIALITGAPGMTNTLAAIKSAIQAESALVLIGQSSSPILKEERLSVTNVMKTLKPMMKWTGRVTRIRDIAYELREALRQALHGTPGPVYIEFNLDVLNSFPVVKKELDRIGHSWYLDYYIQNLFAAGFDVGREIRPWPIEIPFPKKDQISKIVKTITKSEKPIIILGSQATLPPIEDTKISSILQELNIPTFAMGTSCGILPKSSPITMRHGLQDAIQGADLILLLGISGDFKPESKSGSKSNKDKLIVSINRNKNTLKANCSNFGTIGNTESIHSDVGQFLVEISEKIGRFAISQEWVNLIRSTNLDQDQRLRSANNLAAAMDDSLPDGQTILISDGSEFSNSVLQVLKSKGTIIESPTSSKLGSTPGYAIGLKVSKPESVVVSLHDPSSMNYVLSELSTNSRHVVPVINVAAIPKSGQVTIVDPCGATYTNLSLAAEENGSKAFNVSNSDLKSIKSSFDKAVNLTKEGSSVLISVIQDS